MAALNKEVKRTYLDIMEKIESSSHLTWSPNWHADILKIYQDAVKRVPSINQAIALKSDIRLTELLHTMRANKIDMLLLTALEKLLGNHINNEEEYTTFKTGLATSALIYKTDSLKAVLDAYNKEPVLIMVRLMELVNIARVK
jgi:hypothetical protein